MEAGRGHRGRSGSVSVVLAARCCFARRGETSDWWMHRLYRRGEGAWSVDAPASQEARALGRCLSQKGRSFPSVLRHFLSRGSRELALCARTALRHGNDDSPFRKLSRCFLSRDTTRTHPLPCGADVVLTSEPIKNAETSNRDFGVYALYVCYASAFACMGSASTVVDSASMQSASGHFAKRSLSTMGVIMEETIISRMTAVK